MRKILLALLLVLLAALPAAAGDLTVSAAASLTEAFSTLKAEFERTRPGVKLTMNYAASGPLLAQMEQGAPVDVFASADQKTMDMAADKGLIDSATRINFARNVLVLAVPAGNPAKIGGLEALTGPAVKRIAIGNPASVPVGRYTQAALAKAGIWDDIGDKRVLGESVRQVLDYLARGEVDAGFVYATDAMVTAGKVSIVAEIPLETPVSYPIAVTAGTKEKTTAADFVAFVKSPEGQAVLSRFGFKKP